MSFDRTIAGIDSIKQRSSISVDELYDIIVCVLEDVYEIGGVEGISQLPINNEELYARKMNRIASALSNSFEENREALQTLRENLKERCNSHNEAILSIQSELAAVSSDILKANEIKEELERQQRKLNEERGYLLTIADENERLKKEIERLSDPALDKMSEENRALKGEAEERQRKETELQAEKGKLVTLVDGIVDRISKLNSEISGLKNEEKRQKGIEDETKEIKRGYEIGIEKIKGKIEELKEWIKNVSSTQGKLNDEKTELQNRVNILVSVWNKFAQNEQGIRILKKEEYDEIPKWFENKVDEINRAIMEIQVRIKTLIEESEKLTK